MIHKVSAYCTCKVLVIGLSLQEAIVGVTIYMNAKGTSSSTSRVVACATAADVATPTD
jgi:hypothetical protein